MTVGLTMTNETNPNGVNKRGYCVGDGSVVSGFLLRGPHEIPAE